MIHIFRFDDNIELTLNKHKLVSCIMKKLSIIFLFLSICCQAQVTPSGFSFQSVIRTADGRLAKQRPVTLFFTLRPAQGANATWQERQTITTDAFGVVSTTIGLGQNLIAGGIQQFKDVNFTNTGYWMKVTLGSASGAVISDQAFATVPYARYAQEAGNTMPPGTIVAFGGDTSAIPNGWLLCDGTILKRNDYPALFRAIGTAWGTNASDNFYLPYTNGLFLRGAANGAGNDPDRNSRTPVGTGANSGDNVGSYQVDELRSHTHSINQPSASFRYDAGGMGIQADRGQQSQSAPLNLSINPTGGNETRPANVYVNYIIKY